MERGVVLDYSVKKWIRLEKSHDVGVKEKGGIAMGKFQIPSIPATTNKTIRFPNSLIDQVEQSIQGKNCTFSAFVVAAVRAALDGLKVNT